MVSCAHWVLRAGPGLSKRQPSPLRGRGPLSAVRSPGICRIRPVLSYGREQGAWPVEPGMLAVRSLPGVILLADG